MDEMYTHVYLCGSDVIVSLSSLYLDIPLAPFRFYGALSTCNMGHHRVCRSCSCPWRGHAWKWSCRQSI